MTDCPKCAATVEKTGWPFLKGGTGANGDKLVWWRCSACNALFSDLTPVRQAPPAQSHQHAP
jgi:hypothetical protein